tara:strand:+ start:586 stop:765 length:180 start_codon:yes stop_codon:yes gene_type:complete
MLKKKFRKDGIIYINNDKNEDIQLSYYIINNYNKNKDFKKQLDHLKKKYYEENGYQYNF